MANSADPDQLASSQIQISWLLQKPTDLDLHCLQSGAYPDSAGVGLIRLLVVGVNN